MRSPRCRQCHNKKTRSPVAPALPEKSSAQRRQRFSKGSSDTRGERGAPRESRPVPVGSYISSGQSPMGKRQALGTPGEVAACLAQRKRRRWPSTACLAPCSRTERTPDGCLRFPAGRRECQASARRKGRIPGGRQLHSLRVLAGQLQAVGKAPWKLGAKPGLSTHLRPRPQGTRKTFAPCTADSGGVGGTASWGG